MKRLPPSVLFVLIGIAPAFGAGPVATVTSAEPFALDGHFLNTPGVSSFPLVLGDTVATLRGSAVVRFFDGSAMKLGSNSSFRLAGVEGKPKIVLLGGALDYRIVPGSAVSVTNLDGEHRAMPTAATQPDWLQRPGQIATQASDPKFVIPPAAGLVSLPAASTNQ